MLHYVEGDLLKSDCTIIAHQANCFKTMGAGIAAQIKRRYPGAYEADVTYPAPPTERLGRFSYYLSKTEKRFVFNLYGQYRYGRGRVMLKKERSALEESFEEMMKALLVIKEKGFPIKLGIPHYMGSDRGGRNWEDVVQMMEKLSKQYDIEVHIYRFTPR